jgi:hypothetical protein
MQASIYEPTITRRDDQSTEEPREEEAKVSLRREERKHTQNTFSG